MFYYISFITCVASRTGVVWGFGGDAVCGTPKLLKSLFKIKMVTIHDKVPQVFPPDKKRCRPLTVAVPSLTNL
jgi:hypothetical protein